MRRKHDAATTQFTLYDLEIASMSKNDQELPFSQRYGYEEVPPQLKLNEVSPELRRLLDYALDLEIARVKKSGFERSYFAEGWLRVSRDFHVRFLRKGASSYENSPYELRLTLEKYCAKAPIQKLFDLVEFFAQHRGTTDDLRDDLSAAFHDARAAYRLADGRVIAIGSGEQGKAVETALTATEELGANSARQHLVAAGIALRTGDWPGSVRESIHAVEAIARWLEPEAKTIAPALSKLEKSGHLHPALKSALSSLYGYTSDEEGVRHAKVFNDEAQVDEADALFMLGACASFVSYVLAKSTTESR